MHEKITQMVLLFLVLSTTLTIVNEKLKLFLCEKWCITITLNFLIITSGSLLCLIIEVYYTKVRSHFADQKKMD
jgi:hypothetical protein